MPKGTPQDDTSAAPQGFAQSKLPDGTPIYVPDDQTDDQIKRSSYKFDPTTLTDPNKLAAGTANQPAPSWVNKTSGWLWTPAVSPQDAAQFWARAQFGQTIEQLTEGEKQPGGWRSRVAKEEAEIGGNVVSSLGTRGGVLLTAAGGAEEALGKWALSGDAGKSAVTLSKWLQPLLKAPGYTASAYFGLQGLGAMLGDRREGESDDDVMERRILGATAFLGTLHGTVGGVREALSGALVHSFGLDEDLASKVSARVDQLEKIRAQRDTDITSIERERDAKLGALDVNTRRQVAGFQSKLDKDLDELQTAYAGKRANVDRMAGDALDQSAAKMTDLQRQQLHQGSQIISETVQAIREMEGDRDIEGSVKKPFREIGEQIKKPVSDASTIRGIVEGELTSRGVNLSELPPAALKALGKETGGAEISYQGHSLDPSKPGDARLIEALKSQGATGAGGRDISFDDLTRVRDDLYDAASASKDGAVRGALMSAYEKVTDMQETAAEKAGLGGKYKRAKADYMVFKRGLGSGMMQKWLSAQDVQAQDMQAKVGKLVASDDARTGGAMTRAIRTILKAAGIDTSSLDDISKQLSAERDMPSRIESGSKLYQKGLSVEEKGQRVELEKGTQAQIDAANKTSKERAAELDMPAREAVDRAVADAKDQERQAERHDIIPKYTTEELAGKSNEELYRIKLGEMAEQAKGRGMNVTPIVMTLYGILHASAFPFLYGMARGGIPEMVKNPAFQDWVIERSGVNPRSPQANQLRRAVSQMGPMLRRMERTGVPQAAAMTGVPNRKPADQTSDEIPSREDRTVSQ